MEYSFPPAPPGYTVVILARSLLGAWGLIGFVILAMRMRRWKFIRAREIVLWILAAAISGFVVPFGFCDFPAWDENNWLLPSITAALAVSIAGVTIGLTKLACDGYAKQIRRGLKIAVYCAGLFIVIAVLAPPALSVRNAGKRTQCKNNMKQIGLAMHNFADIYKTFPPAASGEQPTSWRVQILPMVDHVQLFNEYDQTVAWNQPPNSRLALIETPMYRCPSSFFPKDATGRGFTDYAMPTGPGTIGANLAGTRIGEIADGTSNTLMIVEASGAQIIWTEPRDVDVAAQPAGINLNGNKPGHPAGWLSSYHKGGTHVLLADGSVRFLSVTTDPAVLKKLVTIDGGEPIQDGTIEESRHEK